MKSFIYKQRGMVAAAVLLYCVGAGILTLCGWHYGSQWMAARKVKSAEKTVDASTQAAIEADAAAKAAAEKERATQAAAVRGIQRASTEAQVAVEQLPSSAQKDFALKSFGEIDLLSSSLAGNPEAAELAQWRELALNALAGQAAAERQVADQDGEIRAITGSLQTEQAQRVAAEARSSAAIAAAHRNSQALLTAQAEADEKTSLLATLKWWGGWLAAVAAIAAVMKALAAASPAGSLAANIFDLASKTAHFVFAPALVLSEHALQRGWRGLTNGLGRFMAEMRATLPAETHEAVTDLLNRTVPTEHQEAVNAAFHAAVAVLPAEEAKAKAALAALKTTFQAVAGAS